LHLIQWIAFLEALPWCSMPAHDRRLVHVHAEHRHLQRDFQLLCPPHAKESENLATSRIASATDRSSGRTVSSSTGAYGTATSGTVTRLTGAFRNSKARSDTSAAISAAAPHVLRASSTITRCPVRRTDSTNNAASRGNRVLGSITSTSIPSAAT